MKRLEDLDVAEVSLVGKPANRRKFLVTKSDEEGESMDEILKAVLETDLQNEAEVEKVLKAVGLSDKAQAAVRGALKIMTAYKDELPKDILKTLAELAGYGYPAPAEKAKDEGDKAPTEKAKGGGDAKKDKEKYGYPAPVKKADGTWDLSGVPEELRPSLETIFKEHEELVKKAAEAEQKAAATEAVLKAERDERAKKEFIAKAAAEYPNLPVKAEEFGLVLKGLSEKAPDEYKALEPVLKSVNDQLGQSKLFAEVGSGKAIAGGDAWTKINAAADALVQKDVNLTREQAIRKVLDMHPELYAEHVKEMQGK